MSASWLGHRVLHRDEVRARVTDEREEEQAGVQAAERVGAVDEVVTTAQHPHPAVVVGVHDRDVGVGRHDRPATALHREVRVGVLAAPGQRRPLGLRPADELLLVAERLPVPDLDRHVHPPGREVGATRQPAGGRVVVRRDPHVRVERVRLLRLDVLGAVLEAEQVARGLLARRRRRRAAEAELRPAHGDGAEADAREVADRVDGDLRVVGAGLHAQVAAGARRVEVVGREVRQRLERRRPPVGEAEPVAAVLGLEERRSEPEGEREPGGRQADRLAGVVGRYVVVALRRPHRPGRASLRHPRRRLGPRLQQRHELLAGVGGDVEGREVQPVLGRRDDAGLVGAVERVGAGPRAGRAGVLAVPGRLGADAEAGADTDRTEARADQGASGDRGHATTAAVSRDSGSDSALTASASSLTSARLSSS